jgi:oligopeptide/dipeptide ABC transporter ATP-binding protein
MPAGETPLLQIRDLHTGFRTDEGDVEVLAGLDLSLKPGETLGIVGESGCGKSVAAMWIMRLLPSPPAYVRQGDILLGGNSLLAASEGEMRAIRGNRISMVFQEPMTSLNPTMRVGLQVAESIALHQRLSRSKAMERAVQMLDLVGIPAPEQRSTNYPHEMSGGMRQRVMIAMALACNPEILIADEPTTALDVTIQAQILFLLTRLKQECGSAVVLITHDLGVVAETADSVAVLYAGAVVEYAAVDDLFAEPLHPYTLGLLASVPRLNAPAPRDRRLPAIPGTVPPFFSRNPGCSFAERCGHVAGACRKYAPPMQEKGSAHFVKCFLYA